MIKIKIHSVIDLITNSSMEIYTYSGSSPGALKNMVDELFKIFNIDKKCDDVFNMVVLADFDYYSEYSDIPEDIEDLEQLYKDVEACKVPKPEWFNDVEESENDWNGFSPETSLILVAKKPEYEELAKKVKAFLTSQSHEASRDG